MKFFACVLALCAFCFGADIKPDLKIGDNEIFVISLLDAEVNVNLLVPKSKEDKELIEKTYQNTEKGRRLQNVVLVKNPNFTLLIDSGLLSTISKLKGELKLRGVEAKQITHVAISHAHPDHIGGVGEQGATFSKAKLLIAKPEVDYWLSENDELTKKRLNLYKNRIEYYKPNEEIIKGSNILPIFIPGHTPGMTIFNFNDEFYDIADMIYAYDIQIKNPQIAHVYDVDRDSAIKNRTLMLNKLLNSKIKVIGTHLPYSTPKPLEAK